MRTGSGKTFEEYWGVGPYGTPLGENSPNTVTTAFTVGGVELGVSNMENLSEQQQRNVTSAINAYQGGYINFNELEDNLTLNGADIVLSADWIKMAEVLGATPAGTYYIEKPIVDDNITAIRIQDKTIEAQMMIDGKMINGFLRGYQIKNIVNKSNYFTQEEKDFFAKHCNSDDIYVSAGAINYIEVGLFAGWENEILTISGKGKELEYNSRFTYARVYFFDIRPNDQGGGYNYVNVSELVENFYDYEDISKTADGKVITVAATGIYFGDIEDGRKFYEEAFEEVLGIDVIVDGAGFVKYDNSSKISTSETAKTLYAKAQRTGLYEFYAAQEVNGKMVDPLGYDVTGNAHVLPYSQLITVDTTMFSSLGSYTLKEAGYHKGGVTMTRGLVVFHELTHAVINKVADRSVSKRENEAWAIAVENQIRYDLAKDNINGPYGVKEFRYDGSKSIPVPGSDRFIGAITKGEARYGEFPPEVTPPTTSDELIRRIQKGFSKE